MKFANWIIALLLASTASAAIPIIQPVPANADIGKLPLKANTTYYCPGAVTMSAGIILPQGSSFDGRNTGTLTIAKTVGLAFNCIYPDSGVTGFKLITGGTSTVLISCGSKGGANGCYFTHNTTADGWNLCFQTVGGGTGFNFSDNIIGVCNNYPVYCVDDGLICNYNTFGGSIGQYIIRLTNNGGTTPGPKNATIVGNILDQRVNKFGKQAVGMRMASHWVCSANTFYGSARIGEVDATTDIQWCDGFTFTNNIFVLSANGTGSAPTNAIAVLSGSTGNIAGNVFQPQANLVSPIAISSMNAVTVTENVQQLTAAQKPMPLIPSSSDPKSYHAAGNTTAIVKVLPMTEPAGK